MFKLAYNNNPNFQSNTDKILQSIIIKIQKFIHNPEIINEIV